MKSTKSTYQTIRKLTAFILLLAFLIPSALQAKQLAEFCMMDHHDNMNMMADQSCCQPLAEKTGTNEHQQHDCDEASLCTCNIIESVPGEEEFVQPVKKHILQIPVAELQTPFFTTDQPIKAEIHTIPADNNIPLWLMFDTFLM